jgi:hypothetical protein
LESIRRARPAGPCANRYVDANKYRHAGIAYSNANTFGQSDWHGYRLAAQPDGYGHSAAFFDAYADTLRHAPATGNGNTHQSAAAQPDTDDHPTAYFHAYADTLRHAPATGNGDTCAANTYTTPTNGNAGRSHRHPYPHSNKRKPDPRALFAFSIFPPPLRGTK